MKLKLTRVLMVLLSLTFLSSAVFAQDMEQIREKVDAVNATLTKAILENDMETPVSLYTDKCWSLPSYSPMLKGKAAIKKAAKENAQNQMKMTDFKLKTVDIFTEGDLVVEIGEYELEFEMPGMPEPMSDKGKYLTIFEMQDDGSLLMKAETWNTDMNPWEMMGDTGHDGDHEMEHDEDHDMDHGKPEKEIKEKKAAKERKKK
jgi:uncharacterized protein (TIGR02246 family)